MRNLVGIKLVQHHSHTVVTTPAPCRLITFRFRASRKWPPFRNENVVVCYGTGHGREEKAVYSLQPPRRDLYIDTRWQVCTEAVVGVLIQAVIARLELVGAAEGDGETA